MKPIALSLLACALLSGSATAQVAPNHEIIDFRVVDIDGELHRIGAADGYRPVVLVFLDTGCPVANRYAADLNELADLAQEQGLEFYGILSDPLQTVAGAQEFRDEASLEYPILFDSTGELAQRLHPSHVPEAFVIGKQDEVLYRGRIDNRFVSVGRLRQQITEHDLRDAIRDIGSGKAPKNKRTEPVGCVFEAWSGGLPEPINYNQHIQPILAANCVECHTDGGSGPFALDNYKDVARRAGMISLVTQEGLMPPWHANRRYRRFQDDRTLSSRQLALLDRWSSTGKAEGDPEFRLANREIRTGWSMGEPDVVLTMEEAYELPASGPDQYRRFVMKWPYKEEVAIVGIDIRPGDPQVVHHVNMFYDATGAARARDEADPGPGYDSFGGKKLDATSDWPIEGEGIGAWAPGSGAYRLPKGVGMWFSSGGDIMIEVHYHLSGRATKDRTSVGFYLAKEPLKQTANGFVMGSVDVNIPAGKSDYLRQIHFKLPADLHLVDLSPHMHYLGTECWAEATTPDGKKIPLIRIDDWDFRWQGVYRYRDPLFLPKGSRIDAWFRYDNSKDNPDNPTIPPKRVRWGWQSDEEMLEIWATFIETRERDSLSLQTAAMGTFWRGARPE